ncbi:MAG TPA: TonB family protein [Candidatus Xenobia bacterium]|nr:TonB family protein [Candidatus Xenobia bacterium]
MKGVGERHSDTFRWARTNLRLLRRRVQLWERRQVRNLVLVLFEPDPPADPDPFGPELDLSGGLTLRTIVCSAGLHVLLVTTPLPEFLAALIPQSAQAQPELEEAQLATSRVLPPIYPRRMPKSRPNPGGKEGQPLPPLGAEARAQQTIVSTPKDPNHPRQTLLQQFGRERLRVPQNVNLPNMVIPPDPQATPVGQIDLSRLRVPNAPVDPNGSPRAPPVLRPRRNIAQLALQQTRKVNLYPRLTLPEGAGGGSKSSAPEINLQFGTPRSGDLATPGVLALSATPGAPRRRLELPDANLRTRFVSGPYSGAGSPGGVPTGVPGAEGGSGGGPGGVAGGGEGLIVPGVLVTPAGEVPLGPVIVGRQGGPGVPPPPPKLEQPAPSEARANSASTPPSLSPLERGRQLMQEAMGGGSASRRVFVTYLYLANLTSQSSSWLLQFAERNPTSPGPVLPPRARKKVDPCYPSEALRERVEGVVVVYGIIRADGRVEDAVVMKGANSAIDRAALDAFSSSLFEPGRKNGRPVDVEALVEIPFRLVPCM